MESPQTRPLLIGFYSPVMQCGKTTACRHLSTLVDGLAVVAPFAKPLKRTVEAFLMNCGIPMSLANEYIYKRKEEVIPEVGRTARYLCQTLGTEWGRNLVKGSVWVDGNTRRIKRHLEMGHHVFVDDVRFHNEYEAIRSLGGYMVRINRPSMESETSHASEGQLNNHEFDFELLNDSSLEIYHNTLDTLFDTVMQRHK